MKTGPTTWSKGGVAAAIFAVSFVVYLATLAPTITWRHEGADSAELIAASYTLGIAHPPGYPTYVLLGKAFSSLVPLGEVAYRFNLMSALFAAATVALVFLIVLRLLRLFSPPEPGRQKVARLVAAGVAALTLAFSPVFWSQAIIAEVHALHAFFMALTIYLLLRWLQPSGAPAAKPGLCGNAALWAASFVYALSLGNHLIGLLIAPALLFLAVRRGRPSAATLLGAALFFALGLSVYLFLPWRAAQHPLINWGDPQTMPRFLWLVSGAPYRQFLFSLPLSYLPARLGAWSSLALGQFTPVGIALGVVGLWYCWRRHLDFAIFSAASFVLVSAYAIGYNTTDSYIYLIPAFLLFSVWLGVGIYYLIGELACPWLAAKGRLAWARLTPALALFLLLIPAFSLYGSYDLLDLSHDREAYLYAEAAFKAVEPNAVIIADTDRHIFPLWYFRYVADQNSEVIVLAKPLLGYQWYRDEARLRHPGLVISSDIDDYRRQTLAIIEANRGKRPIYSSEASPDPGMRYLAVGPLFRLLPE